MWKFGTKEYLHLHSHLDFIWKLINMKRLLHLNKLTINDLNLNYFYSKDISPN